MGQWMVNGREEERKKSKENRIKTEFEQAGNTQLEQQCCGIKQCSDFPLL